MKFLKENVFLVVTLAVTLVGAGILAALIATADAGIKQCVDQRLSLTRQMDGLARQRINQAKVEGAQERVQTMRVLRRRVADDCLKVNRRNYQVLGFEIAGKKWNAFPVDPKLADRATLRLLFPSQYRQQVLTMLNSLRRTVVPTEGEIKLEAERITAMGMAPTEGGVPSLPIPGPTRVPGMPPYPVTPHYTPGPTPTLRPSLTPETAPAPMPSAQEIAQRNLVLDRAQRGWIYADESSMDLPLVSAEMVHYGDEQLWMAQVGLWVQNDIIEAVRKTIEEGQRGGRLEEKGVPASAVKRLVRIRVPGYVVKRSAGAMGGMPTGAVLMPGLTPPVAGPAVPTPVPTGLPTAGAAGPAGPSLEYVGGFPAPIAAGSLAPPPLTGRTTNQLYDVLHYEFAVIMPSSYLLRLYRNLLLQNYHTILDVRMSPAAQTVRTGGESPGAGKSDLYYYGNDGVTEVTIVGEMLLLADFTRGRFDAQAGAFEKDYPPLMPVQFLKLMGDRDPESLRQEDKDRLSQEAGVLSIPGVPASPVAPGVAPVRVAPAPVTPRTPVNLE